MSNILAPASGRLSRIRHDQVLQFQELGYVAVPGFFETREIEALRQELARLRAAGKLRNVATDGDGITPSTSSANLQICPISPISPLIRSLHRHPAVLDAVGELVGHPLLFRLDQIFLKPAGHGSGTSWHQDNAYWHVPDPSRGTGMWIALHDANVDNGTMHIVPGAHQALLPHRRDPGSDHHIRTDVDESLAIPIEIAAGGVLFFNFGIPHSTRGNRTAADRAALALHFINAAFAPASFFDDRVVTYVTGPQAVGPAQGATWEDEVGRILSGS